MKFLPPASAIRHTLGSPISVAIVFLVFVALPALLYSTYTANYHNQNNRIKEQTSQIQQDISDQIGEIRKVMSSLVGLHYTSKYTENNDVSIYAQELLTQRDFIKAIGRYQFVTDSDRLAYEERMSEKGLFNFKITGIREDGLPWPRNPRESYLPISMLEPLRPENARLLGADLAVIADLRDKLMSVTSSNSQVLTTLPAYWPNDGDIVMFAPVYRGNAAPSLPSDRLTQSAGGFLISIDVTALVAAVNPNVNNFDVIARVHHENKSTMVFGQLGNMNERQYLASLYLRKAETKEWAIGDSSLTFSLQQDLGFTKRTLLYFITALLSILAVTSLITVFIISKRAAARDQLAAQKALFQERERAEHTLNTVQDAIISLDSDGRVIYINPAASIQFKTAAADAVGRSLDNFVQFRSVGDDYSIFNMDQALQNLALETHSEYDVAPLKSQNPDFILRLTITRSLDSDENVVGHVLVLRDISHARRLTKKLAYQANHDALTGCTNRHYFENTLSELVASLPGSKNHHALCYIDLDQFKVVNDTCGHAAGDKLLIDLTGNLKLLIPDTDVLSRLGGDEFGVIFKDVSEEETAEHTQRIHNFFNNYVFQHDGKAFAVRASMGVVHMDKSSDDLENLLASADIACYAAKNSGRNCVRIYSKTDDAIAERSQELSWLPRLRSAIANDEFKLLVQAVASVQELCNDGEKPIKHYEFLIRLENSDGSLSTPWQFIQAAERYDLITEVDRWVIRNAFRMVSELTCEVCEDCSFSINLSGQSAADPTLINYIEGQLAHYKVNPAQIWFEVTETAAISNFTVAVDLINGIKELGSLVALDDFGSGLSSFGYLKNLPVDILKIDGQFVKDIAKNPIDREMVSAMHRVGRSMGIKTVAEFVEDEDIVRALLDIGVDYAQGYHIGKPMLIEEAIEVQQQSKFKKAA